jgi:hypothetical protein
MIALSRTRRPHCLADRCIKVCSHDRFQRLATPGVGRLDVHDPRRPQALGPEPGHRGRCEQAGGSTALRVMTHLGEPPQDESSLEPNSSSPEPPPTPGSRRLCLAWPVPPSRVGGGRRAVVSDQVRSPILQPLVPSVKPGIPSRLLPVNCPTRSSPCRSRRPRTR